MAATIEIKKTEIELLLDSKNITLEVPTVVALSEVISVNGQKGNVVLDYEDVGADADGAADAVKAELTPYITDLTTNVTGKLAQADFDAFVIENNLLLDNKVEIETFDLLEDKVDNNKVIADEAIQAVEDLVALKVDQTNFTIYQDYIDTELEEKASKQYVDDAIANIDVGGFEMQVIDFNSDDYKVSETTVFTAEPYALFDGTNLIANPANKQYLMPPAGLNPDGGYGFTSAKSDGMPTAGTLTYPASVVPLINQYKVLNILPDGVDSAAFTLNSLGGVPNQTDYLFIAISAVSSSVFGGFIAYPNGGAPAQSNFMLDNDGLELEFENGLVKVMVMQNGVKNTILTKDVSGLANVNIARLSVDSSSGGSKYEISGDMLVDNQLSTAQVVIPNTIEDGTYLRLTKDATLLGTKLETGDFFQLYANRTKGIPIRQDEYFQSLVPDTPNLSSQLIMPLVCRDQISYNYNSSVDLSHIENPVSGNYVVGAETDTNGSLRFVLFVYVEGQDNYSSGWYALDQSSAKDTFRTGYRDYNGQGSYSNYWYNLDGSWVFAQNDQLYLDVSTSILYTVKESAFVQLTGNNEVQIDDIPQLRNYLNNMVGYSEFDANRQSVNSQLTAINQTLANKADTTAVYGTINDLSQNLTYQINTNATTYNNKLLAKADLVNGVVPSSQLPSYVDDVIESSSSSNFPTTGEAGKIYVDTTSNKTYRWGGSGYNIISDTISLGETSSTAYRGDRGKIAYDHSQATGNPHGTTIDNITGLRAAVNSIPDKITVTQNTTDIATMKANGIGVDGATALTVTNGSYVPLATSGFGTVYGASNTPMPNNSYSYMQIKVYPNTYTELFAELDVGFGKKAAYLRTTSNNGTTTGRLYKSDDPIIYNTTVADSSNVVVVSNTGELKRSTSTFVELVQLTKAQYDALTTADKNAVTKLYVIVG